MLIEILNIFKEMLLTMGGSAVGTGSKIVSMFFQILYIIKSQLPYASPFDIILTFLFFGMILLIVLNTVVGSIRTLTMIGIIVIGMLIFISILNGTLF